MASRLWRFLNTDLGELLSGETVSSTVEATGAVFELAEVLEKEGPNVATFGLEIARLPRLIGQDGVFMGSFRVTTGNRQPSPTCLCWRTRSTAVWTSAMVRGSRGCSVAVMGKGLVLNSPYSHRRQ
jgi:hypothetical protein